MRHYICNPNLGPRKRIRTSIFIQLPFSEFAAPGVIRGYKEHLKGRSGGLFWLLVPRQRLSFHGSGCRLYVHLSKLVIRLTLSNVPHFLLLYLTTSKRFVNTFLKLFWSPLLDSNQRPPLSKSGTLDQTELRRDIKNWSGWRESNSHEDLGKVPGYHYITPAYNYLQPSKTTKPRLCGLGLGFVAWHYPLRR